MALPVKDEKELGTTVELDKMLENYLLLLARTQPFNLEVSAPASQVFEELAAHWPVVEGWNEQVSDLLEQMQDFAQQFSCLSVERHLRICLVLSPAPRMPEINPHEPALIAAYDILEGSCLYQSLPIDQLAHNPLFDHVECGMTLLIQPFDSDGDARAVGLGMIPINETTPIKTVRKY